MIGRYKVPILLHPDVEVTVSVAVARSLDEAERLHRGEDITLARVEAAEAAQAAAESFFEPEAIEAMRAEESGTAEQPESDAEPAA